jgi:hypothetical protein
LALVLVVLGGYALMLLLVYVEYNAHITHQDELKEQFDYRTARLDRRCRYFGQYLVTGRLAWTGGVAISASILSFGVWRRLALERNPHNSRGWRSGRNIRIGCTKCSNVPTCDR